MQNNYQVYKFLPFKIISDVVLLYIQIYGTHIVLEDKTRDIVTCTCRPLTKLNNASRDAKSTQKVTRAGRSGRRKSLPVKNVRSRTDGHVATAALVTFNQRRQVKYGVSKASFLYKKKSTRNCAASIAGRTVTFLSAVCESVKVSRSR